MDWIALRKTLPTDDALPARANRIAHLQAVLDGKMYDGLQHPFSQEMGENKEYIPLDKRRPSVRTNICSVVVEDSVSLLFSEEHWPPIRAKQEATIDSLTLLAKHARLNEVMLEAATRGSVGSVAIFLKIIKRRPFFEVLDTAYLTPKWNEDNPEELDSVVDLHPTTGRELRDLGYTITDGELNSKFWFKRAWTDSEENWFKPIKSTAGENIKDLNWVIDDNMSVTHNLGFCPIVWIRNLPTAKRIDLCDGACTFEKAIDTVIESDYLLSQGGRALKYAADPTIVIKQGTLGAEDEPVRVGGAARALSVDTDGDAKLLEINGTAAKAVLDHVTHLRGVALEAIHGNRANADRLSAATSGRAIELMMAGLIALADRLRISYGEGGLLKLLHMICKASSVVSDGLLVGDKTDMKDIDPEGLELRWPAWLAALPRDILDGAQALVTAVDGNVISRQTAVARFGAMLGVDDATEEFARVEADIKDARAEDDHVAQRDADLASQVKANLNEVRAEAA